VIIHELNLYRKQRKEYERTLNLGECDSVSVMLDDLLSDFWANHTTSESNKKFKNGVLYHDIHKKIPFKLIL